MDLPPVAVGSSATRTFSRAEPSPDAAGSVHRVETSQKRSSCRSCTSCRDATPLQRLAEPFCDASEAAAPEARRATSPNRAPRRTPKLNDSQLRRAASRRTPATPPTNGTGQHERRLRPVQDPRRDRRGTPRAAIRAPETRGLRAGGRPARRFVCRAARGTRLLPGGGRPAGSRCRPPAPLPGV